jgi:VWFA-related protein
MMRPELKAAAGPLKHSRLGAVLFLSLLLCCGRGAAQSSPSGSEDAPVIRVSSEFVLVDALVENRKTGALMGSLGVNDFQLSEDGIPQTITYFSHDQLPLSVVFLFDLTMTVRPVLKLLAEAAREILGHLKPQDEVAVMVFSSHTELLEDFTTDRSLAAAAVEKASEMKSGDGTFIHEDMYEAVEQATKSTVPQSRRALVWLTDGTTNLQNSFTQKTVGKQGPAYLHTKAEATDKLLHSGVAVSALIEKSAQSDAVVAAMDATPFAFFAGARVGDVKRYAEETGGPVLNSSRNEVAARLALLIDELRNRYTLGYKPEASKPEGTFCKVELELRPEVYREHPDFKRRDIVVRTKRGYYR